MNVDRREKSNEADDKKFVLCMLVRKLKKAVIQQTLNVGIQKSHRLASDEELTMNKIPPKLSLTFGFLPSHNTMSRPARSTRMNYNGDTVHLLSLLIVRRYSHEQLWNRRWLRNGGSDAPVSHT